MNAAWIAAKITDLALIAEVSIGAFEGIKRFAEIGKRVMAEEARDLTAEEIAEVKSIMDESEREYKQTLDRLREEAEQNGSND